MLSIASAIFSAFVWYNTDQRSKEIEKRLYKRDRWSEIRADVVTRRTMFEDQLAQFQHVGREHLASIDFVNQIRTAYKVLLASHTALAFALDRAAASTYIHKTSEWRNLSLAPIKSGETVIDRTGELMNVLIDPSGDISMSFSHIQGITTEFAEMLKVINTRISVEDIEHDPDKI